MIIIQLQFTMGNIEDEAECNEQEYNMQASEYQDYRDIVIEIDDTILNFISSFKIGAILSLEVLVDLADKYECEKCSALFYSISLFEEHITSHSSSTDISDDEDVTTQSCKTEIINEEKK